jgi:flagellar biosynthesis protein FlhF
MKDTQGMKIKSYFAKSMDEAISKARVELGADALLLNTRRLPDSGSGAGYEVVMGVAGGAPAHEIAGIDVETSAPPRATLRVTPAPPRPAAATSAASGPATAEMEKLRAQMDDLQNLLVRSARSQWTSQQSVPEVAEIFARLDAAEVDPVLSRDIAARLEAAMATDAFFLYAGPEAEGAQNRWKSLKSDPARVENFLRAELESRVVIRPRLGIDGSQGAVAAVVGPTGSGKTTSLAKLAVIASAQRPVRFVSLDKLRSGAQQLLSSVATPGITFTSVESLADLPKLVAEARKKECVLIDAPGFSAHEQTAAAELAAVLDACGDVDVHLVAPAYMRGRDLRSAIERYRVFQPSKLLITRLDETETLGTVFSEAAHAGLALSFLSHGTRIPEDIRPATVEDLLAMVPALPRARAHHAA